MRWLSNLLSRIFNVAPDPIYNCELSRQCAHVDSFICDVRTCQILRDYKIASDEFCPVCGYECLGKGGIYCIDKPTLFEGVKEKMSANGWIGVDLDGTLAQYEGWKGFEHIGDPIMPMLERVKQWRAQGRDVRIFTARVSHDGSASRMLDAQHALSHIMAWCAKHLGEVLPVTCTKDFAMIELWDDRAVQVHANTGEPVGFSTRGL